MFDHSINSSGNNGIGLLSYHHLIISFNILQVKEFANGFTLLREMGFSSNNVADALIMYDNDTDKALAQLINAPS